MSQTDDTDKIAARLQTLEDTVKGTTNAMVELLRQIQKERLEAREKAEKEKEDRDAAGRHWDADGRQINSNRSDVIMCGVCVRSQFFDAWVIVFVYGIIILRECDVAIL